MDCRWRIVPFGEQYAIAEGLSPNPTLGEIECSKTCYLLRCMLLTLRFHADSIPSLLTMFQSFSSPCAALRFVGSGCEPDSPTSPTGRSGQRLPV